MGFNTTVMYGGYVIYPLLGGILAGLAWNYAFLHLPSQNSIVAETAPFEHRAAFMDAQNTMIPLGMTIGPPHNGAGPQLHWPQWHFSNCCPDCPGNTDYGRNNRQAKAVCWLILLASLSTVVEPLIIAVVDSILSLHTEGEVFHEIILSSRKPK
jgi:MFS family permease